MEDVRAERARTGSELDGENVAVVSTDGGRSVSYAEYGASDGTPLVFLHGTPGSRLLGGLFDEDARRSGVRLLALDRPGYGRSSPWPTRTLADTGEFVAAVLDDAGISRAGVVGFSGGGPHALALAATRGDLVREVDVVAGATPPSLRSTRPTALRLLEALAGTAPLLLRGGLRAQRWFAERASPSFVVSQYTTSDGQAELSEDVAELVKRDFVEALARSRRGFVTESRLLAREWDFPVTEVDRRVRLWHGGRDANVPVEDARRMADRLPNARLTTFDEADHLHSLLRSGTRVLERQASTAE